MKKRPHVALIVETSKQYGRSLIMGRARALVGVHCGADAGGAGAQVAEELEGGWDYSAGGER